MRRLPCLLLLATVAACGSDRALPSLVGTPADTVRDGLWITGGFTPTLLRVDTAVLRDSGQATVTAATAVTPRGSSPSALTGIAFDPSGTMWIASADDSLLLAFPPGALASSGAASPGVVIRSLAGSLRAPSALAFDRAHRLWVANFGNGTLVRFDPDQLTASGSPAPAVVLTGPAHPTALAFDAAGTLWVADVHDSSIYAYAAAQLEASGAPAPTVVLSAASDRAIVFPSALAFDRMGDLWVASIGSDDVAEFLPSQLGATGAPLATVRLASNAGALDAVVGLAFDDVGALWAATDGASLVRLDPAQLAASGAPVPSLRLRLSGRDVFWALAFWPIPAALPLR